MKREKRQRAWRVCLIGGLAALQAACAPTESDGASLDEATDVVGVEPHEARERPSLQLRVVADFQRPAAVGLAATRRVIRSEAEYRSLFGEAPPASLDLAREWAVFYSAGRQPAAGYRATVLSVQTSATNHRILNVTTRLETPGARCDSSPGVNVPAVLVAFVPPRPLPTTGRYYYRAAVAVDCECSARLTACGDRCVDTRSDGANCGRCSIACAPGTVCAMGACASPRVPRCTAEPRDGLYVTVGVSGTIQRWRPGDEVFWIAVTNPATIQQVLAKWREIGQNRERVAGQLVTGVLRCERTAHNCGYSWHLDPATIELSETAFEACEGLPSYVEQHCEAFARENTRFCPWTSELIEVRDCRTDAACPVVPN